MYDNTYKTNNEFFIDPDIIRSPQPQSATASDYPELGLGYNKEEEEEETEEGRSIDHSEDWYSETIREISPYLDLSIYRRC